MKDCIHFILRLRDTCLRGIRSAPCKCGFCWKNACLSLIAFGTRGLLVGPGAPPMKRLPATETQVFNAFEATVRTIIAYPLISRKGGRKLSGTNAQTKTNAGGGAPYQNRTCSTHPILTARTYADSTSPTKNNTEQVLQMMR